MALSGIGTADGRSTTPTELDRAKRRDVRPRIVFILAPKVIPNGQLQVLEVMLYKVHENMH
jgi:hypothetical protein